MIEVKNLWKSFRIFHEREPSTLFHGLKGVFNPRRYEEFWALQDINFHVSEGEFFGVIGENGSGKTTLLKLIAKVLNPTKGSIVARGRVVPFLELGLGFHDESSGRENAMLYGQLLGISKSEMKKNMDELIEFAKVINAPIRIQNYQIHTLGKKVKKTKEKHWDQFFEEIKALLLFVIGKDHHACIIQSCKRSYFPLCRCLPRMYWQSWLQKTPRPLLPWSAIWAQGRQLLYKRLAKSSVLLKPCRARPMY